MNFSRAFAALAGASAIAMAAQLVRGKLAALFLGPAGVGLFNLLTLAWNIANTAGALGVFSGIVQHGADALTKDDTAALQRLASTFTLFLGAVSLAIALTGALLAAHISNWLLSDGGAHAELVALIMLTVPVGVSAMTWCGLLSAARAVPQLARGQMVSELASAALFAVLIVRFNLGGAIIGFLASHLVMFAMMAFYVRKILGPGYLLPRAKLFSWAVVRSNVDFGTAGLLLTLLVNLGVMLVSQMLIARLGPEANGYFANGWRIASVYLGAVTATTVRYFLPSLTQSETNAAMSADINTALRFYLIILTPIMAAIMAVGPWLVWLILSSKFAPVAPLLLLFVPAELARIGADTMLTQFVAKRRLRPYNLAYCFQFAVFVGSAWLLIPRYGIPGAAAAYGLSTCSTLIVAHVLCTRYFAFRADSSTARLALLALALLAAVAALCLRFDVGLLRLALGAVAGGLWIVLAARESDARNLMGAGLRRLGLAR